MILLSEKTFENETFKKIISLIRRCFFNYSNQKNFSFSSLVTYQEFKEDIQNFIMNIMKSFFRRIPIKR